jgi:hypothetical protein
MRNSAILLLTKFDKAGIVFPAILRAPVASTLDR